MVLNTKKNYQIELDNVLSRLKAKDLVPSLLLHSCCGPCSSYVLSYLMEYFDITLYFYNPNIYPKEEFNKRLKTQLSLISQYNKSEQLSYELHEKEVIRTRLREIKCVVPPYDHNEFLSAAEGLEKEREGGSRCEKCFQLRLGKTFAYAKEHGFDYFGTTLTVSPHKNAVLLNEIGSSYNDGPCWLVSDFKKREGYKVSTELSKQYDLFRQDYCGCEYAHAIQMKEMGIV